MSKFENISNEELAGLINSWIKSERDRKILYRRLIDGMTYDELAEEFCLSYDRVKKIVYKQQKIIFDHVPEVEYIAGQAWYPITTN